MRTLIFVTALLVTAVLPAHGDFKQAVAAYQAKQFEQAYNEFRRLAELGDTPSQRNLAAMYARGEYVGKDLAEAWAWAALATEAGDADSQQLLSALDQTLSDAEQRAQAEARSEALRAQFGRAALAARVFPVVSDRSPDCTVEVTGDAKPVRTAPPKYPVEAAQAGVNASVCMSFYLDADGKPTRIRANKIDAFYPDGQRPYRNSSAFAQAALASVKQWRFVPGATDALREIPARYCMEFHVSLSSRSSVNSPSAVEKEALVEDYEKTKAAALTGDPEAQYRLSMKLQQIAPHQPEEQQRNTRYLADKFLRLSAVNGNADGQFRLASNLLTGNRCEKDTGKGILWLQFAAQQGQRNAQYLLASRLLRGDGVERNDAKALVWLKAASESGHERAKIEYAYLLLQQRPARLQEAIALLPAEPDENDLPELEAVALSKALQGEFTAAARYQQLAIDIANEVGFATERRLMVLQAFQAGRLPTATIDS